MIKIAIYIAIFILGIFSSSKILAQENSGVTISPVGIDIRVRSEENYTGSYTITNNESADFNLNFFEGDILDQDINQHDLEWFKLDSKPNLLPAETTIEVKYSISVPKDTSEGVHNKLLLAELTSVVDGDYTSIALILPFRVNIIIDSLFAGTGGVVIKDFNVRNKLLFSNQVNLDFVVANEEGSSMSRPIGNLNIINPSGQIVFSTVLNDSLASLTEEQSYNIEATLPSLGVSDIGQYTAQVLFTDSITNKSSSQKITFVIVNKIYIVISLIFAILVLVFVKFNSELRKIVRFNNTPKSDDPLGYKKNLRKHKSK